MNIIKHIPDWLIIDSIRYAIGRMSYQVGITTRWLIENWEYLSEYVKEIIKSDIEREFKADDRAREYKYDYNPLGHDCDRRSWEQVRALWRTE